MLIMCRIILIYYKHHRSFFEGLFLLNGLGGGLTSSSLSLSESSSASLSSPSVISSSSSQWPSSSSISPASSSSISSPSPEPSSEASSNRAVFFLSFPSPSTRAFLRATFRSCSSLRSFRSLSFSACACFCLAVSALDFLTIDR